jgi:GNAT superfamily N-acetyltransferase
MKITGLETIQVRSKVKHVVIPFNNRMAYEEYKRTGLFSEFVKPRYGGELVVKVYSDEGITGLGIGGDPKRLQEEIAPKIVGEDPFDVERIHDKLGPIRYSDASLRAPIDCALYDMMGKALGVPVYRLLGGCVRREIPVAWIIGYKTPEETAQDAIAYVGEGYRTLKLKQGFDPDTDVDRVRAVREIVGNAVNIRVDFNGAYDPEEAIGVIRRMERYELEFAEQPVVREDLKGMARVAEVPKAHGDPAGSEGSGGAGGCKEGQGGELCVLSVWIGIYRRRGIATRLMDLAKERVVEAGRETIYMMCTPAESAVRFYLSVGFEPFDVPEDEYWRSGWDGEDLYMEMKL